MAGLSTYNIKTGFEPSSIFREIYEPKDNSQQAFNTGKELRERRGNKLVSDALQGNKSEIEKIEAEIKAIDEELAQLNSKPVDVAPVNENTSLWDKVKDVEVPEMPNDFGVIK